MVHRLLPNNVSFRAFGVSAVIMLAAGWLYAGDPGTPCPPGAGKGGPLLERAAAVRLPFIANEGQHPEDVAFYARTFAGTVFAATDGRIIYSLSPAGKGQGLKGWSLEETLIRGTVQKPRGEGRTAARLSCFKGDDASKWKQALSTYETVHLGEPYPGIEVKLAARADNVEKLFLLRPGAGPEDIRLKVRGARSMRIDETGALVMETGLGDVLFTPPLAYQEVDGGRRFVKAAYRIDGDEYGFEVGDHDRTRALVIDPLLAATYLGGGGLDTGLNIALDAAGCIYASGYTQSSDFPTTPGALDETHNGGGHDVFISKFDPELSTLLASTFLGGSGDEGWFYMALAVDGQGNVYLTGNTDSPDFPTTAGAYDETYNGGTAGPYGCGGDIFIAKLDGQLSQLLASTYLGGAGHDYCGYLALDGAGGICIAGSTSSKDFPVTPGAYDPDFNTGGYWGEDAVVCRLDGDLTTLTCSTYLGGNQDDFSEGIAVGKDGSVFITGWTSSLNFPTTAGAFDTTYNGYYYDAFVSRLAPDLSGLAASTYLGGASWEFGYGLVLDGEDNVYVTGHTASKDFPTTPDAYDTTYNSSLGPNYGDDVFVTRFDPDLSVLQGSTYLGGSQWENSTALALDGKGHIYVAGCTSSSGFPVCAGAYDATYNGGEKHYGDIFVSRLSMDLTQLDTSTFLGGAGNEGGLYVKAVVSPEGDVIIGGATGSTDFPCGAKAFDPTYGGGKTDVFIARLDSLLSADYILHEAAGGTLLFPIDAGSANAGRHYILLGTVTGTSPGTPLPGGMAVLPLNWDLFTNLVVLHINSPLFQDFMGKLDDYGTAKAVLSLGPLPGAAGMTMHFAYALNDPWNHVSDPVAVEIVP